MRLKRKDQKICNKYSKKDKDGLYHCNECPLAIDVGLCKATLPKKEWKEVKKAYW